MQSIVAVGLFVLTYVAIVTDKIHRTVVALAGGVLMVLLGLLPQDQAFEAIDWNVIFLLIGMMVIVDVLEDTGVFQWLEFQCLRWAKGVPLRVAVLLCLMTAVLSAFLDNVTTIVLTVPLTLRVARTLKMRALPLIIAQVLASNIGGTATYIGDPPNILIGSAAGLGFVSFLVHLTPVILVILAIFCGTLRWLLRADLPKREETTSPVPLEEAGITNRPLLKKTLAVLGLVLLGFLLHEHLHLYASTIALGGAALLLLIAGEDPHPRLREVEWTTLFFFVGLFLLVGGLVHTGVIEALGQAALKVVKDYPLGGAMLVLWLSALVSAIVDNIPYTAMMIPLIQTLGAEMDVAPLWWSLALGACLGGNATLVGASANVIAAGICEKNGEPFRFKDFLRYGIPVTLMSLLVSSLYVWLRYFALRS
jgi:Na+/H+ antiporter NhaD/arsenite permease-like protein